MLERVHVCDPYTPQGARISVATTEADDLPTACAECRSGDAYLAAVAPRTSAVENGSTYWYEASETVTIDYGRALGKFLLVFCGLEDYRARNGWLEGSSPRQIPPPSPARAAQPCTSEGAAYP